MVNSEVFDIRKDWLDGPSWDHMHSYSLSHDVGYVLDIRISHTNRIITEVMWNLHMIGYNDSMLQMKN